MNLSSGSKLGPYEIIESIGSGGMGEVWKARDTRLGRTVAIKKVKEQHSERFKQEARSIAALNHPNICQVHDIGPDYLVLEYVDGKPLSSPLSEQETVRLAIQISTALEAAHKKGIIHRDLKPSNIMVTNEGTVKLLDFGLAKLYEDAGSAGVLAGRDDAGTAALPGLSTSPTADFPATRAGAILGTVAYMSPEQTQGKPADARSDIFSFGLVLYEMLSGKRAFSGNSNFAVMEAIVRKDPPPLKTSPPLEGILKRCLEKQPSARYQTMASVKTELEEVLEKMQSKASVEPQPSIAVLPFVNMSGDKEQEYFSDGLAEEIINALTQIRGLKVIARTSAFAFKGKEQDITKIAEALRVNSILEGSVRKAGNRIRVTAQLITASDGSHLWSERFDREMTDVFAIQDEIAQAIAGKLRVHLIADRPLVKKSTQNMEAYNLYLKGRYHYFRSTPESMAKSKEYYEQAIAVDPNCVKAWSGLAFLYWTLGFGGLMPAKAANAKSSQAVLKALELDEMLPEAHSVFAVLRASEFDWKGAEREFDRALQLGPEVSDVWWQYSMWYLVPMGRLDEAVAAAQKALELDPLSPYVHFQLGLRYFTNQQYDLAIRQHRNALELDPHFWGPYVQLGVISIQTGNLDEAIRTSEKAIQLAGTFSPLLLAYRGFVKALTGRISEAQQLLDELQELARQKHVPAVAFAMVYFGLGKIDKCFDWLDRGVDERDALILQMHRAPTWNPIRSHHRYKALLRKMNLEA